MHYNNDAGMLSGYATLFQQQAITTSTTVVTKGMGWARIAQIVLNILNADTDAADLLDVYVDVTPDNGVTWINAVHFPQITGVAAAQKHMAFLGPVASVAATINVTSDLAAGVIRQIGVTAKSRP